MAGVAMGLDFGAIIAVAAAQGVDVELLAECLPIIEPIVLVAHQADEE